MKQCDNDNTKFHITTAIRYVRTSYQHFSCHYLNQIKTCVLLTTNPYNLLLPFFYFLFTFSHKIHNKEVKLRL